MNGHSLKLYFYMFGKSQGKHNNLDFHKMFLEYFSLIANFICLKIDTNKKCFYMFKELKPWELIILIFFKYFFFTNVHHSFWKLKKILTLMIRRANGLELMKIAFITNLSTFGSNMLLTLKTMDFKILPLTKVGHIYVIENMNI